MPNDDDTATPLPPAPTLTGRQRQALRGKAHRIDPTVQVGHAGVTAAVLRSTNESLATHELIKVRLHDPEDKRAAAQALADGTNSVLCGLVGHTVILYRPDPEQPRITLDD